MSYDWREVDRCLEAKLTSVPVPGVSLLVRHRGLKVYEKAFGSYRLDTVVPIASGSKWLTGATLMTLIDEERLSLDTRVSAVLPRFTGAAGSITVRQLLSHTGGFRADPSCVGNRSTTLAACADVIAGQPLAATPGSQFRYGSSGPVVAARMAEVLTGQSWNALFEARIVGPVGMTATRFPGPNPDPAASAQSSLLDCDRFLHMLARDGVINGRRVLSSASVAAMRADQTRGAHIVAVSAIRKSLGSRYGIGAWRDVLGPGPNAFENSSPGAFGFHPWIDSSRDLTGVYLVYSPDEDPAGGWDVKDAVRRAVDATVPTSP